MKTGATNGIIVDLSHVYNGALEYNYLSEVTKDPQFKERALKIRKLLKEREKPRGCYIRRMNIETGQFWGTQAQMFRDTRDFYYTLIKEVYQSKFQDQEALEMYIEAIDNVMKPKSNVIVTSRTGLVYLQAYDPYTKKDEKTMEYEGCILGAMWMMSSHMLEQAASKMDGGEGQHWQNIDRIAVHCQMAKNIEATCTKAHKNTLTHLAPRKFCFNDTMDAENKYWGPYDKQYHL